MGEINVVSIEKKRSLIDYQILTPDSQGIDSFVDIVNGEWGSFFPLNRKILLKRLGSGHLFVGAYQNGEPTGILETIALTIEEPEVVLGRPAEERAKYVCSKIKNYDSLTNFGEWTHFSGYPNVLVLVDITVPLSQRGGPVAPGLVDFGKFFMVNPEKRPFQMDSANYVITFTPDILPLKKWHKSLDAFDTEVVYPNARPGYIKPKYPDSQNVNFMCYLAPGRLPRLGQQLEKVA